MRESGVGVQGGGGTYGERVDARHSKAGEGDAGVIADRRGIETGEKGHISGDQRTATA